MVPIMQIIKINSLIQDATPRVVVTPLGEPLFKLSPVVLTINNIEGDVLEEIPLDGSSGANTEPLKDVTLTPVGSATLGKSEHGSYVNIKDSVFAVATELQKNVNTLVVIEYESLIDFTGRILSSGNSQSLNFTLETTSGMGLKVSGVGNPGGIGNFTDITSANSGGINKTAILLSATSSKVIHNGVVFELDSVQPLHDGPLSVNGSGKTKVTSSDVNYYSIAVYQKDIPSLDAIIEYTKS